MRSVGRSLRYDLGHHVRAKYKPIPGSQGWDASGLSFSPEPSARHMEQSSHDAYGHYTMFNFVRHDPILCEGRSQLQGACRAHNV
jgi:hypothetical protein